MRLILQILQIILALLLIGAILIQSKGTGLSATFGGEFSYYQSKRGVEKGIFVLTIILGISFSTTSFLGFIL